MASVVVLLGAFQLAAAPLVTPPLSDARILPQLPAAQTLMYLPDAAAVSAVDGTESAPNYSDWYYRRLTIHRYGSYAMLPLFAAQYIVGSGLYNGTQEDGAEDLHFALGMGVGALFASNSVTGIWNLWESRKDPNDRKRRIAHATLMLLADAGFVATGILGDEAEDGEGRSTHRTVALTSMATATLGYALMLDIFRGGDR